MFWSFLVPAHFLWIMVNLPKAPFREELVATVAVLVSLLLNPYLLTSTVSLGVHVACRG